MADEAYRKLLKCYHDVEDRVQSRPEIGIVLGSGLGSFAEQAEIHEEISYSQIEGFRVSTAPGHNGRFLFGTLAGREVVFMQGRVHYYEGYDMTDVVLPVRLPRNGLPVLYRPRHGFCFPAVSGKPADLASDAPTDRLSAALLL